MMLTAMSVSTSTSQAKKRFKPVQLPFLLPRELSEFIFGENGYGSQTEK